MTDNEKRAHDLALLVMSKSIDLEQIARQAAGKGSQTVKIDFYAEYKKAYDAALPAFNHDFPSGK